jgi:hypothetical protein
VYRHGVLTEQVGDITPLWQDDFVCFYLGCSFSFENALLAAGVPVANIAQQKNVPMVRVCARVFQRPAPAGVLTDYPRLQYKTYVACQPSGVRTYVRALACLPVVLLAQPRSPIHAQRIPVHSRSTATWS